MMESLPDLLASVNACTVCQQFLPMGPNPIVSIHPGVKILLISQAPGRKAHQTNIPWNDASGDRLREWMDISREDFYNQKIVGILPMGFCYPGRGKSGDLPPRKECAPLWHDRLLMHMSEIKLQLVIGKYAQNHYLGKSQKKNLTETVRHFNEYTPSILPLPHPSPLNLGWLKRNPWFKEDVLPVLRASVKELI